MINSFARYCGNIVKTYSVLLVPKDVFSQQVNKSVSQDHAQRHPTISVKLTERCVDTVAVDSIEAWTATYLTVYSRFRGLC